MGEINRLQLESKEVGRGRTILGTAGIAAREELEATRRVNQNALVAGGLAIKAVEEGRARVVEATEVLKSVDEEFGRARRATEAIITAQDATFEIQKRVDELVRNPNIDPLNLPTVVDREVMAIRNEAVTAGGRIGKNEQTYIINKLGSVRNRQVARARTSGFEREIQEKKGQYFKAAHEITKRMYAPGTSEADRQDLFNDLMVLTESMSFYMGEEAVEKLKISSIKGLEQEQFTHAYMINPHAALERQDELMPNLTPTERAELIGRAERQIRLEHQEERQQRQDNLNRIIDKNNKVYEEAIAAENAGESRASVLKRLRAAQIQDPEQTAAFERYEQRDRTLTGFAKRQAAPVPSDPRIFARLRSRIMGGEFPTLEALDEGLESIAASHSAANRTLAWEDIPALQTLWSQVERGETARLQPTINQAANTLEQIGRDLFVRQVLNADQTRKIPNASDMARIAELGDRFVNLMNKKAQDGTLGDIRTEQLQFIRDNFREFLPGLQDKTFQDLTGFENLNEALAASSNQDHVNRMILTDMILSEVQTLKVTQQKARLEAAVAENQIKAQEARAAMVAQVGEATVRTREEDLAKAAMHDENRRSLEERVRAWALEEEPDVGPRFRMVDGEFVPVDEAEVPVPFAFGEEGELIARRPFPLFRYIEGRVTDVSEDLTIEEQGEFLVENIFDLQFAGKMFTLRREDIIRKKNQIRRQLQQTRQLAQAGRRVSGAGAAIRARQEQEIEALEAGRERERQRQANIEAQRALRESEEKLRLLKEQLGQTGGVPE